jgi:arylsulfatase A-like enzyme
MTQPNIVLVVIDDMPKGMVDAMPYTAEVIRDLGVNFTTGCITTPLCGPSRTSLLLGRPAHSHGMWQNSGVVGGHKIIEPLEDQTITAALNNAGYSTALFGKYMNGWAKGGGAIVPPGWDTFRAFRPFDGGDGAYYNYDLIGTGEPEPHYHEVGDYSTDVIAAQASAWVALQQSPFFLYFAPYGSHGPTTPAPRHVDTWPLEPLNVAVNDSNAKRVLWTHSLPLVDETRVQELVRDQHEVLRSVDDAIAAIVLALGSRIDNTLFIITGDNGLMRGQHRMTGKNLPYQASHEVNMMMRWDAGISIPAGSTIRNPLTNEDITATIAAAAGVNLPGCEGRSAFGNISGGVLLEGVNSDYQVPWIAWRTKRYLYIDWGAGQGEELYDYEQDPYELTNLAVGFAPPEVSQFRAKARQATGGHYPPGFTPAVP